MWYLKLGLMFTRAFSVSTNCIIGGLTNMRTMSGSLLSKTCQLFLCDVSWHCFTLVI
jgi:hypothetical protein